MIVPDPSVARLTLSLCHVIRITMFCVSAETCRTPEKSLNLVIHSFSPSLHPGGNDPMARLDACSITKKTACVRMKNAM